MRSPEAISKGQRHNTGKFYTFSRLIMLDPSRKKQPGCDGHTLQVGGTHELVAGGKQADYADNLTKIQTVTVLPRM